MLPITDSDLQRNTFPFVNISLIIACAAVFVYELTLGGTGRDAFFFKYGLIPNELFHGISYQLLDTGDGYVDIESPVPTWATMLTSMFVHGDWMHFLFNMLFLWVFGDNVEDKFGHFRYLLFYLASGVAAVLLQAVADTSSEIPTIGASGAIAGALGAYLLLFPYSRIGTAVVFLFFAFVRIPAIYLLGFWFLLQFVSGVGTLAPSTEGGVAYWAHVGGFLFGFAVVIVYKLTKGEPVWPRRPGGPPPKQTMY